MLMRRRRRGHLTVELDDDDSRALQVQSGVLQRGTIPVRVAAQLVANPGHCTTAIATLEMAPNTFLRTERQVRIVPLPPPYTGKEPPTFFAFSSSAPLQVQAGRTSLATIRTDAPNDYLDRVASPAIVQYECELSGVRLSHRSPFNGTMQLSVAVDRATPPGSQGMVRVSLSSQTDAPLSTSRPIRVLEYHEPTPSRGQETLDIPAYEVTEVWQDAGGDGERVTWDRMGPSWTPDHMGEWQMNGETLSLLINMDETRFRKERERWALRFGGDVAKRLSDRYVAYFAYHLFQMHEACEHPSQVAVGEQPERDSESPQEGICDPDSAEVQAELGRVAETLIQTMRSEQDLVGLTRAHASAELDEEASEEVE